MKSPNNLFQIKVIAIVVATMLLAVALFLAGCSEVPAKNEPVQIAPEKVFEILKDQTQKDKYTILDVRTKEEFNSGHLDSAVLIPVDELEARFGELDKNKPVIVYCRSGRRSAQAAAILVSKGFFMVYDMTGGINAWTGKGYPLYVESADGVSSEIISQPAGQASGWDSSQPSGQHSGDSASVGETSASAGDVSFDTDSTGENLDTVKVRYITADELNAKAANGKDIIILDVRSEDSYAVKHIKGAINIPYTDFEGRTGELDSSKEIIIYCSNNDCGLSANAATMLSNSGFKNVFALKGGIESWKDKGYPVE